MSCGASGIFEKEEELADGRWIVKDRADGANVNNWHWVEKNINDLFKSRLTDDLANKLIHTSPAGDILRSGVWKDTEVDCAVRARKGKANFWLEAKGTLEWNGSTAEGVAASGTFVLHDIDAQFSTSSPVDVLASDAKAASVVALARSVGKTWLLAKVAEVIATLSAEQLAEANKRLAAGPPPAAGRAAPGPASAATAASGAPVPAKAVAAPAPAAAPKRDSEVVEVTVAAEWGCPAPVLFDALTEGARLSAVMRAPATFEAKQGGNWSILNGAVRGVVQQIERPTKLVLSFVGAHWPAGVTSTATLTLSPRDGSSCTMRVVHVGVPKDEVDRTRRSWRELWFDSMRLAYGFPMQFSTTADTADD